MAEDPALARRIEDILATLDRLRGAACSSCRRGLCGHAVLMSMATGFKNEPQCMDCLAESLERERDTLRDEAYAFIRSKECFRVGWTVATRREGFEEPGIPPCLESPMKADAEWDAGDMGCGDLVMELRLKLKAMGPGRVIHVVAKDPGAPEDMPAWCKLTGHTLLKAEHPDYWIRRKET